MMTKAEILTEIKLKELIGTNFENMISIKKFPKGKAIFYKQFKEFYTYFIIEGHTQHIIYTPEGGEFFREFFKGDIPGLSFSISNKKSSNRFRPFDVDVLFKEDSVIAYLPFNKIMNLEFTGKSKVLETLIEMQIEDHFKEFYHLLSKSIYSDEEFFIKHLEKNKIINMESTKKISEYLNINLRTLQRLLKKLLEKGIIEKKESQLFIKDQKKLEIYKEKFLK